MKHRAICFITVLALCLSLCPVRAMAAGGAERPSNSFTLTEDVTSYKTYDVKAPMVFETGGFTYTVSGQPALRVQNGGELYLTTGGIKSTEGAGIEVLAGGFLCADEPKMTVTGATYGLDIASGARVKLSGGTFTGSSSAIHVEDGDYTALLETAGGAHYAYFDENGGPIPLFGANGGQSALTKVAGETTVTVKECTDHVYIYTANPPVPTHNGVCVYCGAEVSGVFCEFDFSGSHAVCKDGCGHTLDITVDPASEVYDGTSKPSGDPDPVTVMMDSRTKLTRDTDYTVVCETLVDVGETLIIVTGETWTYKAKFSVTRAMPEIKWAANFAEANYDGGPVERSDLPGVTVTAETDSDAAILQPLLYFSYKEANAGDNSYTQGLPTDAGTYRIRASLPETENYFEAHNAELILTINQIDPVKEVPKALDLTYNGSAQKLVDPGAVWDGAVMLFAASENGPWSPDIPTGTNAGFYEVWYMVEETKNYNNVIGTILPDIEIRRKPVTPAVVLEYTSYVYTGGEIQPKVTVRDPEDWKELPGTEYTVTYSNNSDVGYIGGENPPTVTVWDVTGGNYKVKETSVYFDITPADQAGLTITDRPNEVVYGDVFTLGTSGGSGSGTVTWEIIAVTDGKGAVVESKDHANIAVITPTGGQVTVKGVGTVTVRATKSEGDPGGGNHKDATAVWTFTAVPKRVTATVTADSKTYDGGDTATVSAAVPEQDIVSGDTIKITGLSGKFRDGASAGTGKTVDVTGETVITVNGSAIDNGQAYEKYTVTIPGTAAADIRKAGVTVTAPTSKDPVYSGNSQKLVDAASASPSDIVVEYAPSANGPWNTAVPEATDAGRYEVWYRVQESANYTGVPAAMVEATIRPKTVTPDITVTPGSIAYDGSEKRPAVTVKDRDNGKEISPGEYTVTYSNNINVGTATVTVTDKAGGNYTVNGTATFTITAGGGATLTGTPLAKDLTYNGQEQELVTAGTAAGGSLVYGLADSSGGEPAEYKSEIPKGTEAKEYKVYYKVKGDGNHADTGPAWVFVTIEPKTVGSPVIELAAGKTFTYNGSAQKFEDNEITVKDGSDLIPSTEYTVTYSNNVNAGTATVHIKDNNGGNYTVNGSKTFEIGEATAGFIAGKAPAARTLTYNGSAQTLITAGVPDGGTAYYWLEGGAPSTGLPTGTDSGSYKVYYQVRGDSNHADSTQGSLDVTIGKNLVTDPAVELSSTRFRYNGSEQRPTVTVRDGGGYVIAANEYTVTYASVAPTAEGSAGDAEPSLANTVDAGHYYVVVTSKGNNYGAFQKAVKVEIAPAEQSPLTITGKPGGTIYFGDTIRLGTTGGTGNGTVEWSVEPGGTGDVSAGETAGQFTVTKAGSITIKATRKSATGNYEDAVDTWTFTADPAPLSLDGITVTPIADLTYDRNEQALVDVVVDGIVAGGELVYSVNGGGYGPDVPKGTDAREYTVSYKVRATDSDHTDSAVKTVTVTIGKATPEIVELPKGTPITTEQEVQESILEGGRAEFKGEEVEGVFAWSDGEGVWILTPGTCYASAIFTPTGDDAGNFESVGGFEAEFEVTAADSPDSSGSPSGSSGGSPSGGSTGGIIIVEDDDDIDGQKPGTETASVRTSVQNGAASTVVNGAAGDELVEKAIADGSGNVVIKPEITGDVTKTEVSIPASAVGRLGSETDAALTVSTPVADVTIPNGALEALSGAGGDVGVVAERVENTVVLTLTADGRDVGDLPGGLTLTVSAQDAGPGTVAVILYEDGTRETIRRSVAGDGAVRIPLNGSATVEIVDDNSREFTDVSPDSWACGAVTFASAHELFNGTGKTTFSPELAMSRGMLAVVLHNLESNPETAFQDVFADVEDGAWYAEGVSWAADRGIVTGYGNGSFGAADPITREQLAVMLWRYAGSPAAAGNGLNFTDAGNTSSWALDAVRWATENGIINGHGNGTLDPGGPATRAQAAQMMKNFMENT